MIRDVQIVDSLTPALGRISGGLSDMTPVMRDLGEYFVRSTKERFAEGKSPEGIAWAAKSPVTLARYKKTGGGTRPLFGPSGMLSRTIAFEASATEVAWGSNMIYAAMMQKGGTKAQWPHLWGNIPARPFLGVSAEDEPKALGILEAYISGLAGQA
jgi:phage virion morphogenesis protein